MDDYGWPYSVMGPGFRMLFGLPFYALYVLRAEDLGAV